MPHQAPNRRLCSQGILGGKAAYPKRPRETASKQLAGFKSFCCNGDVGECGCVFRCEKEDQDSQMLRFPSDMSTWYSQGILLWRSCGRGDCGLWGCRVANR